MFDNSLKINHAEQTHRLHPFDELDVAFSERTTPPDEVMVQPPRYVF